MNFLQMIFPSKNKTPDLINYIVENKCYSFQEKPFNELDALVLCMFTYLRFEYSDDVLTRNKNISEIFIRDYGDILVQNTRVPEVNLELLFAMANSIRFKDIRIVNFEQKTDKTFPVQFCAFDFLLYDNVHFVSFRGTDSTIVGWHENFTLTYTNSIESFKLANNFLTRIFNKDNLYYIGGHSKGGLVATYTTIKSKQKIFKNIIKCYSFDGPGLDQKLYKYKNYKDFKDKYVKICPSDSVIGRLLVSQDAILIVKSTDSKLRQHDTYNWVIENKEFVFDKDFSSYSKLYNDGVNKWLNLTTASERELTVETLFKILYNNNIVYNKDVTKNTQNFLKCFREFKELDTEVKEQIIRVLKMFFELTNSQLNPVFSKIIFNPKYLIRSNNTNSKNSNNKVIKLEDKQENEKIYVTAQQLVKYK